MYKNGFIMDSFDRILIYLMIIIIGVTSFYTGTKYTEYLVQEIENDVQKELVLIVKKQETLNEKIQELVTNGSSSKENIKEIYEFIVEQKELNVKQTKFNQAVVKTFYKIYQNK